MFSYPSISLFVSNFFNSLRINNSTFSVNQAMLILKLKAPNITFRKLANLIIFYFNTNLQNLVLIFYFIAL